MSKDLYLSVNRPVESEMKLFKEKFASLLNDGDQDIIPMLERLQGHNGKMMRPLLVLLIAKYYGFPTDKIYNVASSVELLHTATLVHDDVVDNSMMRRGQASFNAVFDNKLSILFGDYLVALSLGEMAKTGQIENISRLSTLSGTLSLGEIAQLTIRSAQTLSEETYFDIITRKTACLFACSSSIAANTCGASVAEISAFEEFGRLAGLCFQIRDDIFDFFASPQTGKPSGNDLREGKFTLPAIYALNHSTQDWSETIRRIRGCTASSEELERVTQFTISEGGIEYAERRMKQLSEQAVALLPEKMSPLLKQSFRDYIALIVNRNS